MGRIENEVPIVLEWDKEGKPIRERKLCYTLRSLMRFEDKYGKSFAELFEPSRDEKGEIIVDADGNPTNIKFTIDMVAYLVYIGLVKDDPELTVESVADMIDVADMPVVLPMVLDAVGFGNKTHFPPPKRLDKGKSKPKN